jgi:hypothetical protein
MRKRSFVAAACALSALSSVGVVHAQTNTTKALGIAIVDNGFADQAVIEQAYCPTTPGCLSGRMFYWSCSGTSCTPVSPASFNAHAGQVAKVAAQIAKDHETSTDVPLVFYSITGDPEAYLAVNATRIRVVVNTLGTGLPDSTCQSGPAPPPTASMVFAAGNQGMNGFLRRSISPPFIQGLIDCRPEVTSVSGTLAHPVLAPGLGVWVADRTGLVCTDLGDDNNPCSEYPFFVNSNYSPLTTFGAEACLSTTFAGAPCSSGSQVGTSFAAPVAGGAYLALYRRRPSLTPAQAKSILSDHTPDTFFTINTLPSPYRFQPYSVKILTPASIQDALNSL